MSISDTPAVRPPTPEPSTSAPIDAPPDTMAPWVRVAGWSARAVVALDLLFLALIREPAHPLMIFSLLTLVGVALLRRRPRAGMWVLVVLSVVALTDAGSALPHLAYPTSGADFIHAVVGVFGRILILVAGIASWRGASDASARRVGTSAVGLLGAAALLAAIASVLSSGQEPAPQDAVTEIAEADFADAAVASGGTLFVDNQDLFRHTYTVVGTDIDVHLDARQGERITIDLDPGVYDVICVIPHHDFMTATLEVQ